MPKSKHTEAAIVAAHGAFYFRVLPTTFSYSIGMVDGSAAEDEIKEQGVSALDLSRVLAPKLVTVNPDNPPSTFLSPQ